MSDRFAWGRRWGFSYIVVAVLLLLLPIGLAAEDTDEPVPPTAPAPTATPTSLWGTVWYGFSAQDRDGAAQLSDWTAPQTAGMSLNIRSPGGFDFLTDLSVNLNTLTENKVDQVLQQLSIRFTATDWLALSVGKQRLKWGTGKVFSAIDKGETRSNPLDLRSVVSGVSGIKADILPTDWLGIALVVMPDLDLSRTCFAGRVDVTLEDAGLDIGFGAFKYNQASWKLADTRVGGASLTAIPGTVPGVDLQNRPALFADAAWGMGIFTLYAEAQLRFGRETGYWFQGMSGAESLGANARDELVVRALGGAWVELDIGLLQPLRIIAEYMYNGDGLSDSEATQFHSDYVAWVNAGKTGTALLPPSFSGVGAFRKHYVTLQLSNLAISRYVSLAGGCIASPDGGFISGNASLNLNLPHDVSLTIGWTGCASLTDQSAQANELSLVPFRNRLALTIATTY